jgi:hypothetical protein
MTLAVRKPIARSGHERRQPEAWTRSDAFGAAHQRAGDNKPLYLDHPQFEGFDVRQTLGRPPPAAPHTY